MIQRIQSVYLLVVTILLGTASFLPMGFFSSDSGATDGVFKPLGVYLADGGHESTWGLFAILLLSAIISFCTILLYKNRILQMRMTIFNSILLIGYYIAAVFFIVVMKGSVGADAFKPGLVLSFPAVSIILNYLAWRAIYSDDVMVHAADRLWK